MGKKLGIPPMTALDSYRNFGGPCTEIAPAAALIPTPKHGAKRSAAGGVRI